MTPDLMEEGVRRVGAAQAPADAAGQTESGGRAAGFSGSGALSDFSSLGVTEPVVVGSTGSYPVRALASARAKGGIGPSGAGRPCWMASVESLSTSRPAAASVTASISRSLNGRGCRPRRIRLGLVMRLCCAGG